MTDIAQASSPVDTGPPSVKDSVDSIIDRGYKNQKERIEKVESELAKKDSLKSPPAPVLTPLPENPQSPLNGWGTAATFLATFGSMLTRKPLINALNANADVMEAYNSQNAQQFKMAFDKAKIANENAWKMTEYERELYKDAVNGTEANARIKAEIYNDPTTRLALNSKNLVAHLETRDNHGGSFKSKSQDMANYVDSVVNDFVANNPEATELEIAEKTKDAYGKWQTGASGKEEKNKATLSPEAIDKFAEAVKSGIKPSALGLGYGNNANKTSVLNKVAEKYPDFNMADAEVDYTGRTSEARTVGTTSGKLKLSANALDQAIPVAREAMKNIDLTQFPDLNSFENYARTHTGDPSIAALNTSLQTVMSDYSALIARNGQSTDSTRAAARELVNTNMAKGQLNAVFDIMETEKKNLLKAIQKTKKEENSDAASVFNDGADKETALPVPKDNKYETNKYYDLSSLKSKNQAISGVHKYLGNGQFE